MEPTCNEQNDIIAFYNSVLVNKKKIGNGRAPHDTCSGASESRVDTRVLHTGLGEVSPLVFRVHPPVIFEQVNIGDI